MFNTYNCGKLTFVGGTMLYNAPIYLDLLEFGYTLVSMTYTNSIRMYEWLCPWEDVSVDEEKDWVILTKQN